MNDNLCKGTSAEYWLYSILLSKGFSVYPNICDNNGIDCIICKEGVISKIQIKSSFSYNKNSKTHNFRFGNTIHDFDFVICIISSNVFIIPKFDIRNDSGLQINPNDHSLSRFRKYKNLYDILVLRDRDKIIKYFIDNNIYI